MSSAHARWQAPVDGLLLDIDDTLVDTRAAMCEAGVHAASLIWPESGPGAHAAFSDRYYADRGSHFAAYTRGELTFVDMRRARFEEARTFLGLPPADFTVYEAEYRAVFGESQRLFEDVAPFVAAVRDAGVPVVFLTNSGHDQTVLKLEVTGLGELGEAVTTDTLGVGKPDRRVFAHACDLLGVPAHRVVCVGDTLDADILGARASGIRAAWIQRPGVPTPRDAGWGVRVEDAGIRIIDSLAEVADLLDVNRLPTRP